MRKILCLALFALSACHDARPALVKPPAEYLARVEAPVVGPPEATCDDGSKCYSDLQSANALKGYINALNIANSQLDALRAWFGE